MKFTVTDLQFADLRLVGNLDAEPERRIVVRIDHRLTTTQHEEIALGQMQSAAQRLLPTDAVGRNPIAEFLGVLNCQSRQKLVSFPSGHLPEVLPKLLLRIRAGNIIGGSRDACNECRGCGGCYRRENPWWRFPVPGLARRPVAP